MIIKQKIFYNNSWCKSISKKKFLRKTFIKNKSIIYSECNLKDLEFVIKSAKTGLQSNQKLSISERKKNLYSIYREIKKNYKKIAKLEALETGKKIKQAEQEILHSSKLWLYASKNIKSLNSKKKLNKFHSAHIKFEPVGIISLIVPWNFPFVVTSERLPFMLAMGNSVIIKPSEYASQSIVFLMEIIKNSNLPIGSVNLISGSGPIIGSHLSEDKNINMISFTGSTYVGKKIMKLAGKNIKRLSLELGGKNSIIILKDADLNKSVDIIINSFTGNAGQSCVSTSRLFVDKKIEDKLIYLLIKKLNSIKNFKNIYGYISHIKQYKSIKSIITKNKNYYKNIIYGNLNFKNKNFIEPIIFKDLPKKNIININEIFGPILSINSYNSENEVIEYANSTKFGLASVICSKNKKKALQISSKLKSGRIWINESVKINFPEIPIGGYKESGLNRETGNEGFRTYSEIKSIIIKNET